MGSQASWQDDFGGTELSGHWVGGHLNRSAEVDLRVRDGLRFEFVQGVEYASAGVVTRVPIQGDFTAELLFEVAAPAQGCTFEIAAIRVAPPPTTGLPPTHFDDAHRVFNVHGSPPYVSSELDENDGWRIGWNWGERQGGPNDKGEWVSDNRDNRYGRDQFGPLSGETKGWLRLSRVGGARWLTSARMHETDDWRPSGEQVTDLLTGPVYLRLVAKHWVKRRAGLTVAPANTIVFRRFALVA